MTEDLSLFQEIDESLRVENFEKFLRRYGKLLIAGCVGIVIATALSVFWKNHTKENNIKKTSIIIQAEELAAAGKYTEAEQKFEEAEQGTHGVSMIAKFKRAETLFAAGQFAKAQALYKEVANDTGRGGDEAIRDLAALNASIIASNNNLPDSEQKPLSGAGHPLNALSGELYALQLQKEGKTKEAREILDTIAGNPELLMSERQRAADLRDTIKGKSQ